MKGQCCASDSTETEATKRSQLLVVAEVLPLEKLTIKQNLSKTLKVI